MQLRVSGTSVITQDLTNNRNCPAGVDQQIEILYGNYDGVLGGVNSRESLVSRESQISKFVNLVNREHIHAYVAFRGHVTVPIGSVRLSSCAFELLDNCGVPASRCFCIGSAEMVTAFDLELPLVEPVLIPAIESGYFVTDGMSSVCRFIRDLWVRACTEAEREAHSPEAFERFEAAVFNWHPSREDMNREQHALNGNIDRPPNFAAAVRRGLDADPANPGQARGGLDRQQRAREMRRDRNNGGRAGGRANREANRGALARGDAQYRNDHTYRMAVGNGFRTAQALALFNRWARANIDHIDPGSIPVCLACGNAELELCNCYIHDRAPEPVEPEVAVIGVVGRPLYTNPSMWTGFVRGVRRAFVTPRFDFNQVNNHAIRTLQGSFDPSSIGDELINEELYSYLRVEMHCDYMINGVEDRRLKLEHCRKLAKIWCKNKKINIDSVAQANIFALTVQRACDSVENDTLYQRQDPNWRPSFSKAWVILFLLMFVWLRPSNVKDIVVNVIAACLASHVWMVQLLTGLGHLLSGANFALFALTNMPGDVVLSVSLGSFYMLLLFLLIVVIRRLL